MEPHHLFLHHLQMCSSTWDYKHGLLNVCQIVYQNPVSWSNSSLMLTYSPNTEPTVPVSSHFDKIIQVWLFLFVTFFKALFYFYFFLIICPKTNWDHSQVCICWQIFHVSSNYGSFVCSFAVYSALNVKIVASLRGCCNGAIMCPTVGIDVPVHCKHLFQKQVLLFALAVFKAT